ncbi:MAG: TonB-dependent receptor [Bacteroidia bacterium]
MILYKKLPFLILITLLSILYTKTSKAQYAEIRGFVYDKITGEPIIFNNVVIKELMVGKATDINGFYTITRLKPGTYTLMCWSIGYDTAKTVINLTPGKIATVNLYLKPATQNLNEVVVSAEKQKAKESVNISSNVITQKELKQLPTFGGEPDLVQYLQVLPGVNFSGDQGGQLYIRGGPPVMNKVLLDGIIIYNPFHSIGLFSVFDADIIRNADVSAGGFNAEYGGRIGGIIDVNTREGNKKHFAGKISSNPITSKVLLEGPISPFSEGGASSSYLVSYKTSYLNRTAPILYNYADPVNGLPYSFNDLYGKFSFIGPNGSRVNLFGFNFNDRANFNLNQYNWDNIGVGGNAQIIPDGSSTIINAAVGYSKYTMSQQETIDNRPRQSGINSFNANIVLTNYIGKDDVKYGMEVIGFSTDFTYTNSVGRALRQDDNTTEIHGWAKYKKVFGRLVVEPGFRLIAYSSLSEQSFEPRLGIKYNINSWLRTKLAAGTYSQNLMAAVSDQDVVNLFYGFLSSPDNVHPLGSGKYRRQTAEHIALGFEIDITKNIEANIEGFYKNFSQITNINRDKIFDNTPENQSRPYYLRADIIPETGNAYGADARIKYENRGTYIWAVYSLTFVNRNDGRRNYFPHFDRRHNFNLVYSYTFGKNKSYSVNTRWNFGSGFPFTQTQGFYEVVNFSGGVSTDVTRQNGTLGIYFTDINTGRLPYYHRLDISASKKIAFENKRSLSITAAATNVYNRANIFYFDRLQYKRIDQLPIMPTLGINYSF